MISASDTTQNLVEINAKLTAENKILTNEILYLKEELAQLKKLIYGSRSEGFKSETDGQLSLNLLPENKEVSQTQEEEISYTRKKSDKDKRKPVRTKLPAHLPRREEVITVENLPEGAKKISESVTEIIEYEPGKIYVRRIVRPKYFIPATESIVIAEMPTVPLPYANAGSSLLAYLIISKYVDHLPFHRQIKMFKRLGIILAESTVNDWFANVCRLLEPLYEELKKQVRQSYYIQADETPIKVLTSEKKNSSHKGYFWAYHSPLDKLVCFDYQKGRSRIGPEDFLRNFKGILQSDGYAAYDKFATHEGVTLSACMAHARRKFAEAQDAYPEIAKHVLHEIQKLYALERIAKEENLTIKQTEILRSEKSLPIFIDLGIYLRKQLTEVLPKSAVGKAIAYTLKLWTRLKVYLDKGHVLIDNNLVENTIRPVALGRKNYLFAGSHEGAKRAAMMYSFLGSCKLNNIEPFEWIKNVLNKIPDYKANKLNELLPGYKSEL